MTYQLLILDPATCEESPLFIEGLTLAANLATKPLAPQQWVGEILSDQVDANLIESHITAQYSAIKRNDYSLLALLAEPRDEQLADVAEGFMTLWPTIETQWQGLTLSDGTERMLQALLTTMMLAIDQEQTQQQMREAGIDTPPALEDLVDQLDLMLIEVAQAADEQLVGAKAQSVNPYKSIGRNDPCPCESGRKFKQCCGQ